MATTAITTTTNALTVFTSPTGANIRVVEIDGNPWFVAADVCRALGIHVMPNGVVNTTDALKKLKADEVAFDLIEVSGVSGSKRTQRVSIINESGMYRLVLRSDKPEARAFQDWVTREVLPAIRKDGGYILGEERVRTGEMSEDELLARALMVAQAKIARLTQERDAMAQELTMLTIGEYRELKHCYWTPRYTSQVATEAIVPGHHRPTCPANAFR